MLIPESLRHSSSHFPWVVTAILWILSQPSTRSVCSCLGSGTMRKRNENVNTLSRTLLPTMDFTRDRQGSRAVSVFKHVKDYTLLANQKKAIVTLLLEIEDILPQLLTALKHPPINPSLKRGTSKIWKVAISSAFGSVTRQFLRKKKCHLFINWQYKGN